MTATMTAVDRAEISRRNGRKSRGPGPQGKQQSRWNALKHGMSARMHILPGEDPDAYRRQVDGFLDALAPRNAVEVVLAEQVALAVWKIERAERSEAARVAIAIRAAEATAGLETRDEVAAIGHWLLTDELRARQEAGVSLFPFLSDDRHDPFRRGRGDPKHVVLRLEASAEGCRWLIDQWARLGRRLERGHDWRTNELIVALQLRGQRPLGLDLLEWVRLLEPLPADLEPEATAQLRRRLLLQLDESLPNDPAGQAAALRWVERETARLRELKAAHQRREAADRSELAALLAVDTTAEGERMRRYQLDFDRTLHRALNTLLKLRRGDGVGVAGSPSPDDTPEPDPGSPIEPDGGEGGTLEDDGGTMMDDGEAAGRLPSAFRLPPSAFLEPRAAADPPSAETARPARAAAEPEGRPVPPNEPTAPAGGERIPQNEPGPPADREGIPRNEPTTPADGERTPPNEPGPPADGDRIPQNEPRAPGRIAAAAVLTLAFLLVILLLARRSAAFAGAFEHPAGEPRTSAGASGGSGNGAGPIQNEPNAAGWADARKRTGTGDAEPRTEDPEHDRQRSPIARSSPPGAIDLFPSSIAGARIRARPVCGSELVTNAAEPQPSALPADFTQRRKGPQRRREDIEVRIHGIPSVSSWRLCGTLRLCVKLFILRDARMRRDPTVGDSREALP